MPAPKPGRPNRTREALLRAGRELFSRHPVDAVAIDDIVRAADVAKGSFYNHFTDREALVRAVIDEIRLSLEVAIEAVNADEPDPARRVARAFCIYQRFAIDEPERTRVLVRVFSGQADLASPRNRTMIEDLTAGLAQGRFKLSTVEAAVLYVMGASSMLLARVTRQPTPPELALSLAQQLCALLLRGLGVPGEEAEVIAAQEADAIVRSS